MDRAVDKENEVYEIYEGDKQKLQLTILQFHVADAFIQGDIHLSANTTQVSIQLGENNMSKCHKAKFESDRTQMPTGGAQRQCIECRGVYERAESLVFS